MRARLPGSASEDSAMIIMIDGSLLAAMVANLGCLILCSLSHCAG